MREERGEDAKLINEDPYGKGRMFKIRPDDMDELKNLTADPDEGWEGLKTEISENRVAS